MKVEPIHLFNQAALADFRQALFSRVQPWCDEWVAPGSGLSIDIDDSAAFSLSHHDGESERPVASGTFGFDVILEDYSEDHASVVWRVTPDMELAFFAALAGAASDPSPHGDTPKSELVSGVIQPAVENLICRLLGVQVCSVTRNEGAETTRYSALDYQVLNAYRYFCLSLAINRVVVNIWAPKAIATTISPQPTQNDVSRFDSAKLYPRDQALGSQSLNLKLTLGEAELTIGELTGLKVGDVIGLDKSLDEPLYMDRENADTRLLGYLGVRHGHYGFVVESVEKIYK